MRPGLALAKCCTRLSGPFLYILEGLLYNSFEVSLWVPSWAASRRRPHRGGDLYRAKDDRGLTNILQNSLGWMTPVEDTPYRCS